MGKMFFNKTPAMKTYYTHAMMWRGLKAAHFGRLHSGPAVKAFEKEMAAYCGTSYGKALPLARVAFHYILRALDLPKGSEIIMPPYSMADFVKVIVSLGLKPVFIDVELDTYSPDPKKIEAAVTPKSRVFLMTYLFGVTPNMEAISAMVEKHNLTMIEDFSQNLGCTYKDKKIGSFGRAGIVSLSSLKTCGTFYGGMVVSDDKDLMDKVEEISAPELKTPRKDLFTKLILKSWFYDILTTKWIYNFFTFYVISFINKISPSLHYKLLSGNIGVILGEEKIPERAQLDPDMFFRYTDFQAREGMRQLRELDKNDEKRIKFAELFLNNINSKVKNHLAVKNPDARNTYWRFPFKTKNLIQFKKFMLRNNIETSVNYLPNCSTVKYDGYVKPELNSTSKIDNELMILPLHQTMNEKQILHMARTANTYFERYGEKEETLGRLQ